MIRFEAMVLVGLLWFAAPVRATAQDGTVPADRATRAARIAQLGARIDSLTNAYRIEELERTRDARQSRDTTRIALDTVQIGPLQLLAPAGADVAAVARALETAWSEYAGIVGTAASRIEGRVVTRAMPRTELTALGSKETILFNPYLPGQGGRVTAAHHNIHTLLTAGLPVNTHEWLNTGYVSLDTRLEDVHRTLVLARDDVAQNCLAGSVAACTKRLGLGGGPSNDPAPDPTATRLRTSLLAYTLREGGDGSYARLFTDTTSIDAQLTSAARLPVETLVANWVADVRLARPNIRADVARSAFWTFVWLGLLAVFATRSTRWRLG